MMLSKPAGSDISTLSSNSRISRLQHEFGGAQTSSSLASAKVPKGRRHLRMTEKRRLAIAAPAMKARMTTRSRVLVFVVLAPERLSTGWTDIVVADVGSRALGRSIQGARVMASFGSISRGRPRTEREGQLELPVEAMPEALRKGQGLRLGETPR